MTHHLEAQRPPPAVSLPSETTECPLEIEEQKENVIPKTQKSTANLTDEERQQRRAQANLGTGRKERGMKLYLDEFSTSIRVTKDDVDLNGTAYFKGCKDCDVIFEAVCCKVMVEGCSNMKIELKERIMTQTLEVWKCEAVETKIYTPVKTIQVDLSKNVQFHFVKTVDFHSLVWSATDDLQLRLLDSEKMHPPHNTGFEIVKEKGLYPNLIREIDQFIVRIVKDKLISEQVIRLENGFPSTQREAKEFEDRMESNLKKLAEGAGITIGRKKEAVKIKRNDPCVCGSSRKYKQCCAKA